MYPADDTETRIRLLLAKLATIRARLRDEVERSRALRARIRAARNLGG